MKQPLLQGSLFGFDEPQEAPNPPVAPSTAEEVTVLPVTSDPESEPEQLVTTMPDPAPVIVEAHPVSVPVAIRTVKRGRKPKPVTTASLIPKQPGKRGRKSIKEAASAAELINIPPDDILFQKQYYPMRDVAAMFHVNYSLLRLWANEFEGFLQPRKNGKGDRFFRPEDIKNLRLLHHLLRERKYTMQGAKDYLKNEKKSADAKFEIIVSLQRLRSFLLELKTNLG